MKKEKLERGDGARRIWNKQKTNLNTEKLELVLPRNKGEIGTAMVVVLNGFGIQEIIGKKERTQNRGSHRKREKSRRI